MIIDLRLSSRQAGGKPMKQVELLLLLQEQLDAEDKTLFHVRQIEDEVTGEVITTAKLGRG